MRKGFPWEIWCSCGSRLVALYYRGRRRCHRCRRHCRRCRRRPTKIFKKKIFQKKNLFWHFSNLLTNRRTDRPRFEKKNSKKIFVNFFSSFNQSLESSSSLSLPSLPLSLQFHSVARGWVDTEEIEENRGLRMNRASFFFQNLQGNPPRTAYRIRPLHKKNFHFQFWYRFCKVGCFWAPESKFQVRIFDFSSVLVALTKGAYLFPL